MRLNPDLVVIGSGPGGLAAAIKAKESGVENVLIIERAEQLGGLLSQCIHQGFGLHYFKEDMTGPEYGHRFIKRTRELEIFFLLQTMVLDISASKKILTVNAKKGVLYLNPKAIILAMGCRERTRGAINIPGTRPAGIFTAGTAQRFINVEGYLPGKRIVILGSGDIGMIMARRLTLEGAKIEAVIEIMPYIGGLIRNEVQCLHDFNIPVFTGHTITNIHGSKRIEAVTMAKVDEHMNPVPRTEKRIECDTLLLSVGLIPENELSRKAGVKLDPITGGPVVDERMETSVPSIFACGNVVHVHDLVDDVTVAGEVAGVNAAKYILGELPSIRWKIYLKPGENIRYVIPHFISGQENVTLYMRVIRPAENVTLRIGNDFFKKNLRWVRPSEMIKVTLSDERLKHLEKVEELEVSCH